MQFFTFKKICLAGLLAVFMAPIYLTAQKGTAEFDNEVKIGDKVTGTDQAGMIKFDGTDFRGFDGSNWVSFTNTNSNYANVITVAENGGDFTSINSAIMACGPTSPANPCLVRVMPGTYIEGAFHTVPYLHLLGEGKYNTRIIGQINASDSCQIEGFHISNGIVCNGTSPKIIGNIITNPDGDGILVKGDSIDARPWIKQNEIRSCLFYGINCMGSPGLVVSASPWIILNKIDSNRAGGIFCFNFSFPTISNNLITNNYDFGIHLDGPEQATEPTITDNVISNTIPLGGPGAGIFMINFAAPRIISNDIFANRIGIMALPSSQPSIVSNIINYNDTIGIQCATVGVTTRATILGNHVLANGGFGGGGIGIDLISGTDARVSGNQVTNHSFYGVFSTSSTPIISHNYIVDNATDVNYTGGLLPSFIMNTINSSAGPATAPAVSNFTEGTAPVGP
jgi:parallel beta-helix repeat protein